MSLVVVKIGSSSITDDGRVDREQLDRLARGVAELRSAGHRVVIVTSGAIAAGLPGLGLKLDKRGVEDGDAPPLRLRDHAVDLGGLIEMSD